MNADKAREHFSAYYEGAMDRGLKESFERTLNQDAQVQAEYKAFAKTMAQLESLSAPVPEPPFDLHERIAQRLDRHIYEAERKPSTNWFGGWRKVAIGGLAALAVFAAGISIINRGGGASQASIVPSPATRNAPSVKKPALPDASAITLEQAEGGWKLGYTAKGSESVTIESEDGKIARTAELNNDVLSSTLNHTGEAAVLVSVKFSAAENPLFVVLPPATTLETLQQAGEGDLRELAKAASTFYGAPVVLAERNPVSNLKWTLQAEQAPSSIMTALNDLGYSVDQRANGVIWILPQ